MKKILEITLGIVTSIGGFLGAGSIATAAEAGAVFGFQLLWAILLGAICVIFLVEMSGRLAAVSKHTLVDGVRERFGFNFYVIPLLALVAIHFLYMATQIGGVSIALQLVTGISFQWFALPVALAIWSVLWFGNLSIISNGISLLGLIALVFVFATFKLHPSLTQLGSGLLPTLPRSDTAHYLYIAVGILGSLLTPQIFYFYSSTAVENQWDEEYIGVNRAIASLGMGFGSIVSLGVMIVAALVLHPRGIDVDNYSQAALMLTQPFGYWGFLLFAASLGICCFGAGIGANLTSAYILAQALGWNWGENVKPKEAARFSFIYTVFAFLASLLMVVGIDPLKLTLFTMAITTLILPPTLVPLLILMNDRRYVGKYRNGWISNSVIIFAIALSFVLAIVAIPLEFIGG
ncbi:divalent metal cation transporter [Microcoleus sp. C2C3]|uniref:divalent metal cation transporter n=1 Tax=unclassified Microcoleus TaxID=2642155 RepID=UPI002FCF124A